MVHLVLYELLRDAGDVPFFGGDAGDVPFLSTLEKHGTVLTLPSTVPFFFSKISPIFLPRGFGGRAAAV